MNLPPLIDHNKLADRQGSAEEIKQVVIDDVRQHIGKQKVYDDITLVVLKQK